MKLKDNNNSQKSQLEREGWVRKFTIEENRVNEYKGTEIDWELLDPSKWDVSYDEDNDITTVTIIPDHFSIFRAW